MIEFLAPYFDPRGPINWLIAGAYLVAAWKLANAAVHSEWRGFARWAMISLASVVFLFGIGRYLFGQGETPHWIFFIGHTILIQHTFLTIRAARLAREHADSLMARIREIEGG